MVARILGVGVDFAGSGEDEAGLPGHLLHIGLLDIAGGGRRVLHAPGPGPMLLDPQHAAGLQGGEGVAESLLRQAGGHPVVQVAQEQSQVRRAGGRHGSAMGTEDGLPHRAIEVGPRGKLAPIGLDHRPGGRLAGLVGLEVGGIEHPVRRRQEGAQDVGVPAGPRPELDHGRPGRRAPETQALAGMAPDVPGLVGGCAPVAGDRPGHDVRACRRAFGAFGRGRGFAAATGQSH